MCLSMNGSNWFWTQRVLKMMKQEISNSMPWFFVAIYKWLELRSELKDNLVEAWSYQDMFSHPSENKNKSGIPNQNVLRKKIKCQAPPIGWSNLNFDAIIRDEKTTITLVSRNDKGIFWWLGRNKPILVFLCLGSEGIFMRNWESSLELSWF